MEVLKSDTREDCGKDLDQKDWILRGLLEASGDNSFDPKHRGRSLSRQTDADPLGRHDDFVHTWKGRRERSCVEKRRVG